MQALGGMVAGNPAQGYQQARLRGQATDTGESEAAGDAAFGRALTMLHQGSQAPPTVPPGQPSIPMGGGPQLPTGGMPPGGPQMAQGGPPRPPMPMQPPGGMPQPGPGFQPSPQSPMGGGGPPMGGPGGGQPQFGGPQGGITWQQAIQAVQSANPGIEQNPRALARAVDHFMPIMNQQSLQQWREVQLQLRGAALDVREETARMYETGRNRRAETGIESREGIAGRAEEGRTQRAETAETGREKRSERAETGRQERFQQREQRLQSKADFDREFKTRTLNLAERKFASTASAQERTAAYREAKAQLDAQYRELQSRISAVAGGAADDEQTKNLASAYQAAVKNLEKSFMQTRKGTTSAPNQNMGVTLVQTPQEAQSLPPGTRYRTPDGQEFTR